MALKVREELVGKRFLSLPKGEGAERRTAADAPVRSLPPSELDWRSGVIRASASSLYQQNENDVRVSLFCETVLHECIGYKILR